MTKLRYLFPFTLALLLGAFGPRTATAQSACQWVCVDENCRLDQSSDCGDTAPDVVQESSDAESDACLAEPLTMDMVTNTADTTFTTNLSASDFATSPDTPAPGPTTPPGTTPGTPPTTPATPPATPPAPPKQDVLVTGFCKFGNLTDNPTERILPALEKAVKAQCGTDINLTTQCLNVNVQAIRKCTVQKQIVISLGVDDGTGSFRMETAASNCYVDPFGKVKCDPVCVDPAQPINTTVEAPGPFPTLPPKIGTYPIITGKPGQTGTYVCNATYYWLCTQKECKPYFIHTPNFTKDQDKDVVPGLAKLICDTIAANKTPVKKSLRSLRAWS